MQYYIKSIQLILFNLDILKVKVDALQDKEGHPPAYSLYHQFDSVNFKWKEGMSKSSYVTLEQQKSKALQEDVFVSKIYRKNCFEFPSFFPSFYFFSP